MLCGALAVFACGSGATPGTRPPADAPQPDAPLVAAEPGAWFDGRGNLTVVGPGRRLRLVLSAPIAACGPALERGGESEELLARATLPYHVLSEACRDAHPTILLSEEAQTASPAELENSYREVARCAASDFGLTDGWIPSLMEELDPCPLALGLGWRLPRLVELSGLTIDDRKAIAGALFDPEARSSAGSLVLFARADDGTLGLATLSPNAAERAPALDREQRGKPLFGVALRCVNEGGVNGGRASPPVLPHAAACLREHRRAERPVAAESRLKSVPEVKALERWLDAAERSPERARDQRQLLELSVLLASPQLERLAQEARDERALTERYAELAEGVDDPSVPPSERERRRAEFEHLRRRLRGQLVRGAASGPDRSALPALLARLLLVVEAAAEAKPSPSKPSKKPKPDLSPLLTRLRALSGRRAP